MRRKQIADKRGTFLFRQFDNLGHMDKPCLHFLEKKSVWSVRRSVCRSVRRKQSLFSGVENAIGFAAGLTVGFTVAGKRCLLGR